MMIFETYEYCFYIDDGINGDIVDVVHEERLVYSTQDHDWSRGKDILWYLDFAIKHGEPNSRVIYVVVQR